jgi:8-oxo-dGTP pyrophosphatase MutT (NUDIX family)
MSIEEEIAAYVPYNEQEERDKELILRALKEDDIFLRSNVIAHMSASSWVVNQHFDKVLMCFHKIYQSWSWLGGHADGNKDLKAVALKEVREESGLQNLKILYPGIFSIESLTVDGHIKKGKYVSSHLHLNVTYLLQADENEPLRIKEDENTGVRWFTLDGAIEASSEPWFKEHVYNKLNKKLLEYLKEGKIRRE